MSPLSQAIWLLARWGAEAIAAETTEGDQVSEAQSPSAAEQPAQEGQTNEEDNV